jgi:dihydroorotate dehydrogenase
MYSTLLKPLLFCLPPESAHDLSMQMAHLAPWMGKIIGTPNSEELKIKVGNLAWSAPWGLAAGLDKNVEAVAFFSELGFGAIECGTITLYPQIGNAKPRMFRLPEEKSLRNSMGFPSKGIQKVADGFFKKHSLVPVGANIGKNKESSPKASIKELKSLQDSLAQKTDYFVINVSSPNTPGLRHLQDRGFLSELFTELKPYPKDLYLKIAPDLDEATLKELYSVARDFNLSGLIATNTTMMPERGVGGVSGELLKNRASQIYKKLLEWNGDDSFEIIAVGGINSWSDVIKLWGEGGKAFQVYTAFIYEGPKLLSHFQNETKNFLNQIEYKNLQSFFDLKKNERQQLIRQWTQKHTL